MSPRRTVRRLRVALLASLGAAAACASDATGPDALVQGTYVLRAIGTDAVPAVADSGQAGAVEVLAASLTFHGDGVTLVRAERWRERDAAGRLLREWTVQRYEEHPFTVQDGRVFIGLPCPPDPLALCAYSEWGTVEGSRLRMRVEYSSRPWTYEPGITLHGGRAAP